jgi:hypothetical protein
LIIVSSLFNMIIVEGEEWRESISTEAAFENFKLPAKGDEFLRQSIYELAVVNEMVFPCVLLTSNGDKKD